MSFSAFTAAVSSFVEAEKVSIEAFEAAANAAEAADRARASATRAYLKADGLLGRMVEAGEFDYAVESPLFKEAVEHARRTILLSFFVKEIVFPKGKDSTPVVVFIGEVLNVHATRFDPGWYETHSFIILVAQTVYKNNGGDINWEMVDETLAWARGALCTAWLEALRPEHRGIIEPLLGETLVIPEAVRLRARTLV